MLATNKEYDESLEFAAKSHLPPHFTFEFGLTVGLIDRITAYRKRREVNWKYLAKINERKSTEIRIT